MPAKPEFVINQEPRCPVLLLLDTSGSMSGNPIASLNQGIESFKQEVQKDTLASLRVEVAIVTFGPVELTQEFVTIDNFNPPLLQADGLTPMGEAIEYAMDLLEDRKESYKNNGIQYYRPWIFLITDGAPNPDSPWQKAAQRIRQAEDNKKILFFAVGVEDADMNTLRQIAHPSRPPLLLNGLDFKSMFKWLSASMTKVSSSKVGGTVVDLPPVGWGSVPS